jgi:hypothetical protein
MSNSSLLIILPSELIIDFVSNWLILKDLQLLDNAICNHMDRLEWISTFQNQHEMTNSFTSLVTNACIRQYSTNACHSQILCWHPVTNPERTLELLQTKMLPVSHFPIDTIYVFGRYSPMWDACLDTVVGNLFLDHLVLIMESSPQLKSLHLNFWNGDFKKFYTTIINSLTQGTFLTNILHISIDCTIESSCCTSQIVDILLKAIHLKTIQLNINSGANQIIKALFNLNCIEDVLLDCYENRCETFDTYQFNDLISKQNSLRIFYFFSLHISFKYMSLSPINFNWCMQQSNIHYNVTWRAAEEDNSFDTFEESCTILKKPEPSISCLHVINFKHLEALNTFMACRFFVPFYHISNVFHSHFVDPIISLVRHTQLVASSQKAIKIDNSPTWIVL